MKSVVRELAMETSVMREYRSLASKEQKLRRTAESAAMKEKIKRLELEDELNSTNLTIKKMEATHQKLLRRNAERRDKVNLTCHPAHAHKHTHTNTHTHTHTLTLTHSDAHSMCEFDR